MSKPTKEDIFYLGLQQKAISEKFPIAYISAKDSQKDLKPLHL